MSNTKRLQQQQFNLINHQSTIGRSELKVSYELKHSLCYCKRCKEEEEEEAEAEAEEVE